MNFYIVIKINFKLNHVYLKKQKTFTKIIFIFICFIVTFVLNIDEKLNCGTTQTSTYYNLITK